MVAVKFLLFSSSYAAVLHDDSVMSPNTGVFSGALQSNTQNIIPPGYTSTTINEFAWLACPTGFTYNGNSQYPSKVRTVTTYYLGGIYAGQSPSVWNDLDHDCKKIEYQTIACPTSYTGTQSQSRTVSTKDGNSYEYTSWYTYTTSCVYNPPTPVATCRYDGPTVNETWPQGYYRDVKYAWTIGGPTSIWYGYYSVSINGDPTTLNGIYNQVLGTPVPPGFYRGKYRATVTFWEKLFNGGWATSDYYEVCGIF